MELIILIAAMQEEERPEMSDSLSFVTCQLVLHRAWQRFQNSTSTLYSVYRAYHQSYIATMAEDDFIALDPSSSTPKVKKPRAERVK
jgi:hypothetical protein